MRQARNRKGKTDTLTFSYSTHLCPKPANSVGFQINSNVSLIKGKVPSHVNINTLFQVRLSLIVTISESLT